MVTRQTIAHIINTFLCENDVKWEDLFLLLAFVSYSSLFNFLALNSTVLALQKQLPMAIRGLPY